MFDGVFTIDRYDNAPWYACDDGRIYGTLKTGTAVVARGVPVSFSLSRDGAMPHSTIRTAVAAWLSDATCPVPLTVRGTQALVSFAPLAF